MCNIFRISFYNKLWVHKYVSNCIWAPHYGGKIYEAIERVPLKCLYKRFNEDEKKKR